MPAAVGRGAETGQLLGVQRRADAVVRRGGPRQGLAGECDARLTAPGGQLQRASDTLNLTDWLRFKFMISRKRHGEQGGRRGLPLIVGDPAAHQDPVGA